MACNFDLLMVYAPQACACGRNEPRWPHIAPPDDSELPGPDAAWDQRERQLMKADALDRYVAYPLPKVINITHGFGANDQIKGTVLVVEDEQSTGLSLQIILSSVRIAVVKATES